MSLQQALYICRMTKDEPKVSIVYKLISTLFHPVFFPAVLMWSMVMVSSNVFAGFPEAARWQWAWIITYTSVLFPLLTVFLLWRLKFIESVHMHHRNERYVPMIASMLFYFWLFWLFYKNIQPSNLILVLLLSMFIGAVFTFMAGIFYKVSLHMSGIGHAIAFSCYGLIQGANKFHYFLVISLVVAILLWVSRKKLQAHTAFELVSGLIIGILSIFPSWWIVHRIN